MKFYTTKQAGDILGLSKSTVRRRINAGLIETVNLGVAGYPRPRISEDALKAYTDRASADAA